MGLTSFVRMALSLAAALLLGATTLAVASSASANTGPSSSEPSTERSTTERLASCNWRQRRCYGAISLNVRTGVAGLKNDKRSKRAAIGPAHRSCKQKSANTSGFPGQCRKAGWVRNGCLAVAIRVRNGSRIVEWRSRVAYGEGKAKRLALRAVRGPGEEHLAGWVCTTRRR